MLFRSQYDLASFYAQPLLLTHGKLYIATFDGMIYALLADQGSLLWRHPIPITANEPLATDDQAVYVHTINNRLYALQAMTGSALWLSQKSDVLTFGVMNGVLYIATIDGNLSANRGKDGASLWRHPFFFSTPSSYTLSRPLLVADGAVYIGASDGTVYTLQASNGHELWRYVIHP